MITRMTSISAITSNTGCGRGEIQFWIAQIKPPIIARTIIRIRKEMSNPCSPPGTLIAVNSMLIVFSFCVFVSEKG
jgi:hypothetical protein